MRPPPRSSKGACIRAGFPASLGRQERRRSGARGEAQSRPLGSQIRQSSAGKAPELNGVPQIQSTRAVMRRPPLARPAPQLVIVVIIFSFLLRSAKGYHRRSKPARIIFTSRAPAEGVRNASDTVAPTSRESALTANASSSHLLPAPSGNEASQAPSWRGGRSLSRQHQLRSPHCTPQKP